MSNNRFSPTLRLALEKAGWYPGRQVDDAIIIKQCTPAIKQGYCLFPKAYEVLREFGGLTIGLPELPDDPHDTYVEVRCWTPDGTAKPHAWFILEWALGEALFPIGNHGGEMSLLISSSGKVYSSDYSACTFGDSFEEMLEDRCGEGNFLRWFGGGGMPDITERLSEGRRIYQLVYE
jgi:hypothetical protein